MEDGPATRTRGAKKVESELSAILFNNSNPNSDSESFKTPSNTPTRSAKRKKVSRTPSGQALSSSVEDIRNFFSQESSSLFSSDRRIVNTNAQPICQGQELVKGANANFHFESLKRDKINTVALNDETSLLSSAAINNSRQQARSKAFSANCSVTLPSAVNHTLSPNNRINHCNSLTSPESKSVYQQDQTKMQEIKEAHMEMEKHIKEREARKLAFHQQAIQKESDKQARLEKEKVLSASSDQDCMEPKSAMDVKLVIAMFQELKSEIANKTILDGATRMNDLEQRQDANINATLDLQEELLRYKRKNEVLSRIVCHMSNVIQSLDQKIEKLELNGMRNMIMLSGLDTEPRKGSCLREINNFFNQEMDINTKPLDVFFLNPASTNPMVITLQDSKDKARIFQNLGKLKGLVNDEEKPFFISNYLPPSINETKRRESEIYRKFPNG